jgi:puromycin-sensitive aminopeptidase
MHITYYKVLCVTEFAAGAMENWGLVTYREVDLMIDEHKASSQQKQALFSISLHYIYTSAINDNRN